MAARVRARAGHERFAFAAARAAYLAHVNYPFGVLYAHVAESAAGIAEVKRLCPGNGARVYPGHRGVCFAVRAISLCDCYFAEIKRTL